MRLYRYSGPSTQMAALYHALYAETGTRAADRHRIPQSLNQSPTPDGIRLTARIRITGSGCLYRHSEFNGGLDQEEQQIKAAWRAT